MRALPLLLGLLLFAGASYAAKDRLVDVQLMGANDARPDRPLKLPADKALATADLPLGNGIENLVLDLTFTGPAPELRVKRTVISSIAVGDEGPHLDLVGWRDVQGQPVAGLVARNGKRATVLVPAISAEERKAAKLPSKQDVADELRRRGHPRWADNLLKTKGDCCPSVYAAPSKVRIEVEAKTRRGGWQSLYIVDLSVPMGC